MSKITIKKGKLLKGDRIEVEYLKSDGSESKPAKCSEEHTSPPHQDLKKAFESLAIHAAVIGEYIPSLEIKSFEKPHHESAKNFNVTGFTIVGEDGDEGVTLSARKTLKTGKTMGFNTPTIRLEDDGEEAYPFTENLSLCIARCKDQLREYLNGKFAPDPQGVLFPEKETDKVEEKKRGRKKELA